MLLTPCCSLSHAQDEYYDIDSILAAEERVPCTFEVDAVGLGYLDASCVDDDLALDSKVELPFWLGEVLARKNMVRAEMLRCFNARYLAHLNAGPAGGNLREQNPYFYRIGRACARLLRDTAREPSERAEAEAVDTALVTTFSGDRFSEILDYCLNSRDEDLTAFTGKLTSIERRLFDAGFKASRDLFQWKSRQNGMIEASAVVARSSSAKRRKIT